MRASAEPLAWLAFFGAITLLCGRMAIKNTMKNRDKTWLLGKKLDVAPFVVVATVCLALGAGMFAWRASVSQDHYTKHQQAGRDLKLLQLPATVIDYAIDSRSILLEFGSNHCQQRFSLEHVFGHDPDGDHLRWRPSMSWVNSVKTYGLGSSDIATLAKMCDYKPPQD